MPAWLPGVIVMLILFPLLMWAWTYLAVRWLAFVWRLLTARRGDLLLPVFVAVVGLAGIHGIANAGNGIMRNGFDPPGSCPQGRVASTVVSWRYDGIGRRLIVVTSGDDIWGRWNASAPAIGFPWENVFALLWALPRNGYVAAGLRVPIDLPPLSWGVLNHGATSGGPPIDVSISDWCGDFNPPEPWCSSFDVGTGATIIAWKMPAYPGPALCALVPDSAYYVNIRISDPDVIHDDCSNSACRINVQNNHTP